jgi:hypothetical protein
MTKARVNADNASADIQGVTAGTGLTGGGTSGDVTLTNTMATAIDAKGDLVAGTGADTFSRLAAGSNGETLVADSSTSTGLRYQPTMAAGKNAIINGAFDIWQRGTSIAVNAATYTADRFLGYRGVAGMTVSRQSTNDTTNLPFIQYCARVQRDSGNTSTSTLQFTSPIETSNVYRYTGQTITMSFYARAGANYSPTSSALGVYLSTGTGTDGNPVSGYTGQANAISSSATLTTTWQRFSYTVTLGSTITQLAPYFVASVTGTAGANDWFEVTGVSIELGSVATAFSRTGGTIQGELAACQRYYQRFTNVGTGDYNQNGIAYSGTKALIPLKLTTSMRSAVTAIDYSSLRLFDYVNAAIAITNLTINTATSDSSVVCVEATVASGLTQYRTYVILANTLPSYLGLSAEL